jgi:hypothetical protein
MTEIYTSNDMILENAGTKSDTTTVLMESSSEVRAIRTTTSRSVNNKAAIFRLMLPHGRSSYNGRYYIGATVNANYPLYVEDGVLDDVDLVDLNFTGVFVDTNNMIAAIYSEGIKKGEMIIDTIAPLTEDRANGEYITLDVVLKTGVFGLSVRVVEDLPSGKVQSNDMTISEYPSDVLKQLTVFGAGEYTVEIPNVIFTDEVDLSILPADALYAGVNMDLLKSKTAEAIRVFSDFSTEATTTIEAIVGKFNDDIAELNTNLDSIMETQNGLVISVSELEANQGL